MERPEDDSLSTLPSNQIELERIFQEEKLPSAVDAVIAAIEGS